MDRTPQYIKMCEEAEEIQKINNQSFKSTDTFAPDGNTWLPRQDQLQDMVSVLDVQGTVWVLYKYVTPNRVTFPKHIKTWEQLWLAFVMEDKYGKVWDSKKEEWVKEK